MSEYRRQVYLSSLGIENYMPRWQLPNAPVSIACALQPYPEGELALPVNDNVALESDNVSIKNGLEVAVNNTQKPALVADVLRDLVEVKKISQPLTAPPKVKEAKTIAPFSLSIWRP